MRTMRAFIWGGAIGAVLGLLFAPQRGEVTREQLRERLTQFQGQAVNTAATKAQQAANSVTSQARQTTNTAADKAQQATDTLAQQSSSPTH